MDGFRTAVYGPTTNDPTRDDAKRSGLTRLVAIREELWQAMETAVRDRRIEETVKLSTSLGRIEIEILTWPMRHNNGEDCC